MRDLRPHPPPERRAKPISRARFVALMLEEVRRRPEAFHFYSPTTTTKQERRP